MENDRIDDKKQSIEFIHIQCILCISALILPQYQNPMMVQEWNKNKFNVQIMIT